MSCTVLHPQLLNTIMLHAVVDRLAYGSVAQPGARITVVCGELASRSIVNRTAALWSIWMVSSLILSDLCSELVFS